MATTGVEELLGLVPYVALTLVVAYLTQLHWSVAQASLAGLTSYHLPGTEASEPDDGSKRAKLARLSRPRRVRICLGQCLHARR